MRSKIAFLLSLMLLVTALFPISSFAADDIGLSDAIKAVRSKVDVPENYTLRYYTSQTVDGRKVWILEWYTEKDEYGYISATVDEKGNIWNYDNYRYTDYRERKLPKISWDEAKAKAESFIKKVNPVIYKELGRTDNYIPNLMDQVYSINFYREVNNVEVDSNFVIVEVDRQTGEIRFFHANWQDGLVFPDAKEVIGLEKAKEAYKDKLGLRLEYRYYTKDDEINLFAVYAPKYADRYIDAFTGDVADLSLYWLYRGAAGGMGGMADQALALKESASAEIRLRPEEEEAVRKTSELMDVRELEKKVRSLDFLGITDEYVLEGESLYRDWIDKESFVRYLYFVRNPADENDVRKMVEVSLDAKTGDIKSFYIYEPREVGAEAKFDQEASRKTVEEFLKELNPGLFSQTVYDDSMARDVIPLMEEESKPLEYTFRYIRKIGDAVFPSNSIYVVFDAVKGRVIGYNVSWFNVEFPSLDNVISMEDAYARLFEEVGYGLKYKIDYSKVYYREIYGQYTKPEVRLVYDLNREKPALIGANTGAIVDYTGKPYEEFSIPEYTDISGSPFEEQIKILAENGIFLEGTEFKPNENITQKDFFLLFSKALGDYWYDPSLPEDEEVERLYSYLIRQGIVKAEEKDPDADVSREDAVKFIIRALKYDKVADIKGIFVCDFNDADAINPDLIGYVAIASGLRIISGDVNGNFNPQKLLTRGQTAALIYNYLQK